METKKKRIIIVANFCDYGVEKTNNRFNYLSELLKQSGCEVELITSTFSHREKKQRTLEEGNTLYKTTLIKELGYTKNVCLRRFRSHYVFGKNLKKYLDKIEKPDVVYCAIPSLDAAKVTAKYCKRHNVPFIVDIQDLWPEAFKLVLKIPIVSDIIFAPMAWAANYAYRQADKVVAVSDTYKNRGLKVNKKDKEGLCVFLGTELLAFDQKAASHTIEKPEGELWIGYAGTLGHSYNIEIVIDALNKIADKLMQKVVFKVFGDGPYLERFKEYAKDCKVKVEFFGRLEYSLMTAYLTHCDIAVNPISKGAAQSIINKHGDYAAAGLPVVSTQENREYRSLVEDYHFGINCGVESIDDVGVALLELISNQEKRETMGRNARKLAEEKFDRKNSYLKILEAIETVLDKTTLEG